MPNRFAAQIRSKIDERREAIQRLDRDRDRLRAEMAAYEEMLIIAETSEEEDAEHSAPPNQANGASHHSSRGLSPAWKAIMKRLAVRHHFNFDEAVREAQKEGVDTDKKGMRSRMHSYAQSGYVERIDDGIFRVTPKGHGAAG